MPKKVEEKLRKEAKKKSIKNKKAYIYGTLNKIKEKKRKGNF